MSYRVCDFEKEMDTIIEMLTKQIKLEDMFGEYTDMEMFVFIQKAFKLKNMMYSYAEEQEKMIDTYKEKIDELETRGKELNNKLDRVLRLLEAQQKKD